jgi:hypothetical protein
MPRIAAVPNTIEIMSNNNSAEKEKKKSCKRNVLPPSNFSWMKTKVEKGSVQAPLSKYPGRKTPLSKH